MLDHSQGFCTIFLDWVFFSQPSVSLPLNGGRSTHLHNKRDQLQSLMYGGFQGDPQLGPPDAERRQSLGQQMLERVIILFQLCFY